jgi:MFS family permease
MFNFLDRGVIALLVEPIKRDLHLSDTAVGFLMGPAFVIFYLFLGLPIARLADSRSRRAIIGVGLALWSAMTALCGLAHSFRVLFAFRIGVGVGEACSGPATYSMMADMFPKERLARAIATMNFGFVAGSGLATILAGWVILFVSSVGSVHVPLIGSLHPWQVTFIAVGLPGVVVAALFATVIEPIRRGRMTAAPGAGPGRAIPVRDLLRFLAAHKTTYAPMFLGLACQSVVAFGIQSWAPTFFVRTYGWTIPQYAFTAGILMLLLFPIGLIPGSLFAEWLTRKGYEDANLRVTVMVLGAFLPFGIAFALMPTATLAIAFLAATFLITSFSIGPQNAALQIVTPNEMRGQVTAFFLLIFNLFGTGLAPLVVGFITNYVVGSEAKVGESIALTAAIMGPLALLILWSGLKPYARSVAQARAGG